ncbi:MAG: M48 family metallopeptidase [Candidatus Eiseniibacteriota bacterium]|jgi:STE24 endopeptidase
MHDQAPHAQTRLILFVLLIVLPILLGLTMRVLSVRGDTRPDRRALVLEHFTQAEVERGRAYHDAFQPGGAIVTVLYWGLLGWIVFGGAGRALADWAVRHGRGHLVLEFVLVAVPLFLLIRLALLPISYYHGYVLEGRFDFRRLEFLPWLLRLLKGWGVAAITQLFVTLVFFWLVRRFGDHWVWPAIGGGAVLSYAFIILWPLVVLPLFYEIRPVPDGELREGITELTARAGMPVDDIRMIDASRVSSHANAFFTGIGGRKSIYLYDTLAEEHTTPQILAVVAHEIGHWQHRHVLKGWLLGIAGSAIGLVALRWLLGQEAVRGALGIRGAGDLAVLPLLWLLVTWGNLITAPLTNAVSRHYERQADAAVFELTGDPATFIAMKRALALQNRANLLPHPAVSFWYGTHPPVIERIRAAEAYLAAAAAHGTATGGSAAGGGRHGDGGSAPEGGATP